LRHPAAVTGLHSGTAGLIVFAGPRPQQALWLAQNARVPMLRSQSSLQRRYTSKTARL